MFEKVYVVRVSSFPPPSQPRRHAMYYLRIQSHAIRRLHFNRAKKEQRENLCPEEIFVQLGRTSVSWK